MNTVQRNEPITHYFQLLNVPDDYCTYNVVEEGNLSKCNTKQSIFSVKMNTVQRNEPITHNFQLLNVPHDYNTSDVVELGYSSEYTKTRVIISSLTKTRLSSLSKTRVSSLSKYTKK